MEFGSTFVFAPTDSSQEYEHIPETRYNRVVTGYAGASAGSSSVHDDGEVSSAIIAHFSAFTVYVRVCAVRMNQFVCSCRLAC